MKPHHQLTTGRVRIKDSEPLTLSVSALSDFLWEDFVIDTRPSVNYLETEYDLKQLSRFGKECFQRLYGGDEEIQWLVSLEAYEDWFRAKQNGDTTPHPEGYKPENGIWYSIMQDLTDTGAWPRLLALSVGDQFNAGNNAINIINDLSELIEEEIESGRINPDELFNAAQKLDELRQQYNEAMAAGDAEGAAKAREQGRALSESIQNQTAQAKETIGAQAADIVEKAATSTERSNQQINNMWGTEAGSGKHLADLDEKKALARKLQQNPQLKKIANKVGALQKIWQQRKRAKKISDRYEAVAGASLGNDIRRTLATELATAGTEAGKALFCLKYSQQTLLMRDYEAKRKDVGKGPIVLYLDVSGSMSGNCELFSKAITFVLAEHARKDSREMIINLFDTEIQHSATLRPNAKNNAELLDFLATWFLGGGTSFTAVLTHLLDVHRPSEKADVIMLTDGHSNVDNDTVKRLTAFKNETGTTFTTICIDTHRSPAVVKRFSDEVHVVDANDPEQCVIAFQSQLVQ